VLVLALGLAATALLAPLVIVLVGTYRLIARSVKRRYTTGGASRRR
jgi:hypothetical protein